MDKIFVFRGRPTSSLTHISNPQGRMMITLDTPEGDHAIMAVPHKDRSGNAENSQAYRTLMAAMEAACHDQAVASGD
jgi:hypothetical protein